jgi:hypothetical protein
MITRDDLIHEMAMAITDEFLKMDGGKIDATALATRSLDAMMDRVADPLCSILESSSPFGAIAANQIRSIAGKS